MAGPWVSGAREFGYPGQDPSSQGGFVVRRIVLLSTLTAGRCFTLTEPLSDSDEDDEGERVSTAREIIVPEAAWKVTGSAEGEVQAENALGEDRAFPPATKVVELPRQGFDRLAARVRGER